MNAILKPVAIGVCFVTLMGVAVTDASAWFSARRAIVGTALVVGTVAVASSTAHAATAANANAAAAANSNAAAANANAAAANANAAASRVGTPAVGSIVTTLPPGCVPETLNGVAYERCGSTYYKATMSGSYLVFVVAQP